MFDRLEALPCPSVAAIHGFALGGGLELALACRYRVGVNDERLVARPARGAARHSSGLRRHGARGARGRRAHRHAADAHRQAAAGRQGAARPASSIAWCREPSCERRRASWSLAPPQRRRAPFAGPAAELGPAAAAARALADRPGRQARAGAALPGAVRDHRAVATLRRARRGGLRGRGPLDRAPVRHAHLAQPGARLPAAGSPEERSAARRGADIRRVHVVGAGVMGGDIAAWCALRGFNGDAAGPRAGVHRAGARARARAVRQAAARIRRKNAASPRAPHRRRRRRRRAAMPTSSSRRSSRISRPSRSCTRASSRA